MKYTVEYHIVFHALERIEAKTKRLARAEFRRRAHAKELEAVRNGDDGSYVIDKLTEVYPQGCYCDGCKATRKALSEISGYDFEAPGVEMPTDADDATLGEVEDL